MALSNSTTRILRTTYFDDYYQPATDDPTLFRGQEFDFHRILFRPRFAVQSRELTQLQTILQAQIEKLGTANFKHGQPVYGCQMAINNGVTSGKMLTTANVAAFFNRSLNLGTKIASGNTVASVRQYASIDEGNTDNYLVFNYDGAEIFSIGDTVTVVGSTENASFSSDATGVFSPASVFTIDEGVFFISGFLVRFRPQTIVLDLGTNKPDAVIGILVNEEVLDELDDVVGDTLLDPANDNAPGAHRFRLRLVLASYGLDVETPANFIQLAKVVKGIVQFTKNVSERFVKWSELNEVLARRTYDESGNYMIKPFPPIVEKDPDANDHFRLTVGPGKAYVHGWEVNKLEPTYLSLRKGRVTQNVNSQSIALQVGNYVRVNRINAVVPADYFANTKTVDLHSVPVSQITLANDTSYLWSKIGTAKTRALETDDVPLLISSQANNAVYKLFFFDAQYDSVTGNFTGGSVATNGAVFGDIAIANGVPVSNDAIVGTTIVLGGSGSSVRGTFTINSYSTDGSTANVGIREPLPSVPNTNTTYRLLFQNKDIDAFALYDNTVTVNNAVLANNLTFQADVDPVNAKIGTYPNRFTVIEGTSKNTLIYELPNKFIVANTLSTATSTFEAWVPTTENLTMTPPSGTQTALITISVVGAEFILPTGVLDAETAQRYFVIYDETADLDGRGQIVQFSDLIDPTQHYIFNTTVVKNGSQHDITFQYHHDTSMSAVRTFIGFARATVSGLPVRSKLLITPNTTHALASGTNAANSGQVEYHTLNTAPGFAYSLFVPDVYSLTKVLYKSTNTDFSNTDVASTGTDVTAFFDLDTGQRDNSYEYGRALVKKGASAVIKPTGRLLFIFDWFKPTGRGFATVDSYSGITYDNIPSYTSTVTGRSVSLRDTLDFRPERTHELILASSNTIFAAGDTFGESTYLTSTSDPYLEPTSDDVWLGDYQFYLGRIDTIALCYDGTFTINEGQDAVVPQPPKDDTDDLPLFKLTVPPYTLVDANGKPTSVTLTAFEYKRFTMNDIGKVEDRVAHLEYYTALNSLETITRDQNEEDVDGNERFKNGLLVDSFHGGDVADVSTNNFTASIDSTKRELRTGFRTLALGFSPDFAHSTTANIAIIGDMATLAYTQQAWITQNLATTAISVNPFNISSFYGNVKLLPATDTWKNTDTKPAQVIDGGGPTEAWVAANLPSYTMWGEWEQTWSGVTGASVSREYSTPPGWTEENHGWRSMTETTFQDTETTTTYQRQGTTFEYDVTTTQTSQGNKVVDTSIVHNVRARDIVFAGTGMKPGANLFLFFDGTNVTNYVQKATMLQLASVGVPATAPFYVGQTVYVQKAITGTSATVAATANVVGTGTFFQYELMPGALLHIQLVNSSFDDYVAAVTDNTHFTLQGNAAFSYSGATIYTRTPVTITDVAERYDGANVTYTLLVARAKRDTDIDQAFPYIPAAGALGVDQLVKDTVGPTAGAVLIAPPNARVGTTVLAGWTIANSVCTSGVVRAWDGTSGQMRLDLDSPALPTNTEIRIVGGPGAGQSTLTVGISYTANQTINVGTLTGVVAGESIYTIGPLKSTGFSNTSEVAAHAGTCAGVFHMQEAQFPVGNRLFRLTNSNTNGTDATSSGEAHYEASGITVTQQETIIATRQIAQRQIGVTDSSTSVSHETTTSIEYVDPLAETFLVDAKAFPQGVFVASLDLCFASTPDTDIPVTVEIRTTVNGYPSNREVVPCCSPEGLASVTLRRDRVRTTTAPDFTNPSSYTTFTFPALVYLAPGKEYAIVVRSDSDDYYVWTAEMGALIVGSEDKKVSKQPFAGSFFKSQNASTWTEAPFTDLMFRLNKALWTGTLTTPQQGKLVTRAVPPVTNTYFDSFEFYPHDVNFADVTLAQYILDILPMNPSTNDATSQVSLRYNGFPNEWQPAYVRSFLQGYSQSAGARIVPDWTTNVLGTANTVDGQALLQTWSADVAPYIDFKKSSLLCVQHRVNELGIEQDMVHLTNPGAGYLIQAQPGFVDTQTGNVEVIGSAAASFNTILNAGDTIIVGGNVECIVNSVENSTHFTAKTGLSANRSANTWFTYGTANSDNILTLTISGGNGAGAVGHAVIGRDGKVNAIVIDSKGFGFTETPVFTIPAPVVTGGVDVALQTQAVVTSGSEVGNDNTIQATRYITRPVTLADGFEARDLKVYFDAYRPVTSDFVVYYRVLPVAAGTDARFEDQPWRLMTMVTDNAVTSPKYESFREFQFKTPAGQALSADTDTTDRFKAFAIKVVFSSSSTVDVPRLMNFRAIAFDA